MFVQDKFVFSYDPDKDEDGSGDAELAESLRKRVRN